MNNVYLILHNDGTYEACVDSAAPTDEAVALTREGKYPVLYCYCRLDSNGSSVYEATECTNRDELIDALNFSGMAWHTVRWLWDFDSYEVEYHPVWAIFNAATDAALEVCAREIAREGLFDYFESIWDFEDIWEKYEFDDGDSGYCSSKFINEALDIIINFLCEKNYCIDLMEDTRIRLLNRNNPKKEVVANDLAGIVQKIREWNHTLIDAEEENENSQIHFLRNERIIEMLEKKAGCSC